MERSKYISGLLNLFNSSFPKDWLDEKNWKDKTNKTKLFSEGLTKIATYEEQLFDYLAKLILSGEYFVCSTDEIDNLHDAITERIEDFDIKDRSLRAKLIIKFQEFISETLEMVEITRRHIKQIDVRISEISSKPTYRFYPVSKHSFELDTNIGLLNLIADICLQEFYFSYDDKCIRNLLLFRQLLSQKISGDSIAGMKAAILNAAVQKIELLLQKLSVFSKSKQISYNFNFEPGIIKLTEPENSGYKDFRSLFLMFLDPDRIEKSTILEWQKDSNNDDVNMWQLAFLMRYYAKCTGSLEQINNILKLAKHHHEDYQKHPDDIKINEYASRSFWNYMNNSRFSFLCKSNGFTYSELKKELEKIKTIQNETFIFNFHPYKKAVEFTINWIERSLRGNRFKEDLTSVLADLKSYYSTCKKNIEWCKENQPYLMQLRFNFSCIEVADADFKMFCPSSFCRPIRFNEVEEDMRRYEAKIAILEYEVNHIEDKKELVEAKKKIENMERQNLKQMGLFVSITTFLVGLLSIFVGNNSSVSIFDKMEYVIALGLILIIFVCVGYLAMINISNKIRAWAFGVITLLCFVVLFMLGNLHKADGSNCPKEEQPKQTSTISVDANKKAAQPVIRQGK